MASQHPLGTLFGIVSRHAFFVFQKLKKKKLFSDIIFSIVFAFSFFKNQSFFFLCALNKSVKQLKKILQFSFLERIPQFTN